MDISYEKVLRDLETLDKSGASDLLFRYKARWRLASIGGVEAII